MSIVLVDTDVVSFGFKGDTRATLYAPLLEGHQLAISFMTVDELFQWGAVRKWGPRRLAQLEQELGNYIVIPVDIDLCRIWGNLRGGLQLAGRVMAVQDAWIAATALRHELPLITNNPSDYAGIKDLVIRTIDTGS